MLELPESYTISKQIQKNLTGKIISYIELLHTPHKFAFLKERWTSMRICWKDRGLWVQLIMAAWWSLRLRMV